MTRDELQQFINDFNLSHSKKYKIDEYTESEYSLVDEDSYEHDLIVTILPNNSIFFEVVKTGYYMYTIYEAEELFCTNIKEFLFRQTVIYVNRVLHPLNEIRNFEQKINETLRNSAIQCSLETLRLEK